MSLIVGDNGGDFEPIPLGMDRAICINVFDVGMQPGYQGGPAQKKYVILWELEKRDSKGKRFQVTKIYTQSIGEKSNLGADLTSWRTRPFTAEERKGFDLTNIIGKPCSVNMVQGNGDRAKIGAVLPADKSRPYWAPEVIRDYIPNFVKKMLEARLPDPVKTSGTRTESVPADDGFTDDIPF